MISRTASRIAITVLAGALVLGLAATLATPDADAQDACKARGNGHAPTPRPAGHRGAFAIGDSSMILAAPRLGRRGIDADARGCRGFADGLRIIRARRKEGRLPHVVLLALGSNGALTRDDLRALRRAVGPRRILALATSRNNGRARAAMRAHARADPHRTILVDWKTHSDGRPSWFGGDDLHPNPDPGAVAMARFYAARIAPVVRPSSLRARLPASPIGTRSCGIVRRHRSRFQVRIPRGADRLTCARARRIVRRPPLQGIPGWRWADQRPRGSEWLEGYRRRDGKVVIGLTRVPRPASP
jgi:hypothetical protein